jgi:hypothetical protein
VTAARKSADHADPRPAGAASLVADSAAAPTSSIIRLFLKQQKIAINGTFLDYLFCSFIRLFGDFSNFFNQKIRVIGAVSRRKW